MRYLLRLLLIIVCLRPAFAEAKGGFEFADVAAAAKKVAAQPYRPLPSVPKFLTEISYDDYRDIRFDTDRSLWRDGGNFQVQFIHPGLFYTHPVKINIVDSGGIHAAHYSPQLFDFGKNKFADKVPQDLGFAGFRITYPFFRRSEFNHVIVFAGASYFRAVAKGQVFGLSARGLAIDTGLASGEEFPDFKEFWLERPRAGAREVNLYALLDSPSVAGAYEFVVHPGDRTIVDVRARLFLRKAVKELGIAPLTSMFLFGEERARPANDWRPEVHDSDGLLIQSENGQWIWRPLGNPEKLRVSYFESQNPKGFGLLQRDRSFRDYEDLETRHELRPTAWVTPAGNWGEGFVKLVEIPSGKETNDNIVSYWMPRKLPAVGQPFDIAYKISFQTDDPVESALARAVATRMAVDEKADSTRVVIDFEGQKLSSLPDSAPISATVSASAGGQVMQQNVFRNTVTKGWRLTFEVKRPKEKPIELRAFLKNGKHTLSETWTYQFES